MFTIHRIQRLLWWNYIVHVYVLYVSSVADSACRIVGGISVLSAYLSLNTSCCIAIPAVSPRQSGKHFHGRFLCREHPPLNMSSGSSRFSVAKLRSIDLAPQLMALQIDFRSPTSFLVSLVNFAKFFEYTRDVELAACGSRYILIFVRSQEFIFFRIFLNNWTKQFNFLFFLLFIFIIWE